MKSITSGVGLAKLLFAVWGVNAKECVCGRRELKREGFHAWILAHLEWTIVAMVACWGAYYCGRYCQQHGSGSLVDGCTVR